MRAVNAHLCHEMHASIALRLWRVLDDIFALNQLDIGSVATCQFEPDHELRNIQPMLDEAPARTALFVRLVQQSAPDIVAVLAQ